MNKGFSIHGGIVNAHTPRSGDLQAHRSVNISPLKNQRPEDTSPFIWMEIRRPFNFS